MISRSQPVTAALTAAPMRAGSSGSIGRMCASQPASRAWVASISELVSVISPAPVGSPIGRTSSPVGRIVTTGRRRTSSCVAPAAARGRDVGGAQPVPLGQQQLARAHVLADRPNVLVGGHGGADLRGLALVVHVFAHHHGVPAARHRVAGVHRVVGVRWQADRAGLARAEGVRGAHRDPVHAGRVERRRRADRPHRPGGDQPGRLAQRHQRRREPGRAARGRTRVTPGRQGPGGRDVADERAVRHGSVIQNRRASTGLAPVRAAGAWLR